LNNAGPNRIVPDVTCRRWQVFVRSEHVVIIADLPQRGTMFSLVSIAGELFEVANEIWKGRIAFAGYEEVQMIGHEAVGVQRESISGAGAGEAVQDPIRDGPFGEYGRSVARDQSQTIRKRSDIIEVCESGRFAELHTSSGRAKALQLRLAR
jgi:hypothetical protein